MLFMAILTHTPEHCFAKAEYQADGKKWVEEEGSPIMTAPIMTVEKAFKLPVIKS